MRFSCAVALVAVLVSGSTVCGQEFKQSCPFVTEGVLSSAKLVAAPPGVILQSGEIRIAQKDLDAEIRKSPEELWPQLKRNLLFVLENKLVRSLIRWEAQNWAEVSDQSFSDEDSLIRAYVASLSREVTVSDEEIKGFYDQNKDLVGEASFEQVKDHLRDFVFQQKRAEVTRAQVVSLGDRYKIELSRAWAIKQCAAAMDNPVDKARASGRPSLVDFGADGCRPCEMMTPILDEVKKEYLGRVNVVFVHVRKEKVLAERYGIQSIPVQVFYDKDGQEVFRHVGFYAKDQITSKVSEMGVR